MPGILLDTLRGSVTEKRPVWLMRQAGRYLPEYRELRSQKGGFLPLVYDSDAASEITLQPIRRFGFDGAILFSDILIVPHALGQDLQFLAGEGPALSPRLVDAALSSLTPAPHHFQPVWDTVRRTRAALPAGVTMLGFIGSPWTVATYMVAGEGSKDHHLARAMAYRDPVAFGEIIQAIVDSSITYLSGQIEAGAEAVQLFDSWAGSLSPRQFQRWVVEPTRIIVDAIRSRHPDVPIIGFPKGAGAKLPAYAHETGVDAVGVDETQDPHWVHRELPQDMPVQGNLDPLLLISGGPELEEAARAVLKAFAGRPHVFNLGHGIDKSTPIANVERLLEIVRGND